MVTDPGTYLYLRYIGPDNGYCNVAEVEFYTEAAPAAPTGLVAAVEANGAVTLDWADKPETDLNSYNVYRSTVAGNYGSPLAMNLPVSGHTDASAANGTTYHYTVTAVDDEGYESRRSSAVSVTPSVNQFAPVVHAGSDQSLTISGDAPWTPAQLMPAAWYDAGDASTITESGGAVSIWSDRSGNGFHLIQNNASLQPRTGIHTVNNLTTVKFDGSNDTLATSGNPFVSTISDAMVIAVHRVDATTNGTLFNLSGTSANSGRWQAHAPFGSTLYFDAGSTGGGARVSTNYGVTAGDVVLVSFYSSSTENLQQVYKNGTFLVGDATGQNTPVVGSIHVGSGANMQYQNTSIGEMLILNGTVSTEDRRLLEGYLAHKWGLATSLPAEHPHSTAPPGGSGVVVNLAGTVTDADGTVPSVAWTRISGAGTVTFGDSSAATTTATFFEAGVHMLRLTAHDGFHSVSDDVTLIITLEGVDIDTDGDGVPDFFEYLYGSDPADPSDRGFGVSAGLNPDGSGAVFSWEVLEDFEPGILYDFRISTNLTSWDPVPVEHYTLEQTPAGRRIRFDLRLTHDYGDRVFLRLVTP